MVYETGVASELLREVHSPLYSAISFLTIWIKSWKDGVIASFAMQMTAMSM